MARVKQPAPYWSGTALWKDDFEELSSDQYKGMATSCGGMQLGTKRVGHVELYPLISPQANISFYFFIPTTCKQKHFQLHS